MANINIFALGGQDENGKNSHVVEIENDIFIFNAGNQIPVQNKNGIDGIIPEFSYLNGKQKNIKGLFITHAHDEVFAAIPWLLMEIKGLTIYGSEFTIAIIKDRINKYKISHADYTLQVINNEVSFGKNKIKAYEVANSIPGSLAFNLKTSDGDIVYMSNMVIDKLGPYGNTDLEKIKNDSNNIIALLLDSRIAHYHGSSKDNYSIKNTLEDHFKQAKENQRIIIAAYDEEMYALEEVLELSVKYNRPIVNYGRVYDFLLKTKDVITNKKTPAKFVDYKAINKHDNAIILVTSTWSRLFKRLDRIANNNDVFLKLKENDKVIVIAPPVNGMEVEASQSLDEVAKTAFDIIDINATSFYKMRPAEEDVFTIVSTLKPKHFIPISALYRYLVVASKQAIKAGVTQEKNVILKNGKILHLIDNKIANQKRHLKEYGDVIIDGFGAGDISFEVIREREMLGAGGLISIVQQLDRRTKKPIGNAHVQLVGVAVKHQINELTDTINSIVIQKIEELPKWNFRDAQNNIRKRVRKVMSRAVNKEPLVLVTFYDI